MRHLLLLAVCLAAGGQALADFSAEIELYKENLPTQAELELLKTVSPAYKNAYYPLSWAVRTGSLHEYWFDIDVWPDDLAGTARVEMDTPDLRTLTFFFDGESFYLERGYFTLADLQADFPAGLYSIWVQSTDGSWQSKDFILPPCTDDDFPALVDGQLTWQNNLQRLSFNSVENADDLYTVTAYNLANYASLWQGSFLLTHPQSAPAEFGNILRRGRYDSEIDVEAQALLDDSNGVEIWMIGTRQWWSLRKLPPVLKDQIDKCTVAAGAKNIGTLVLSGQLQAIEADFRNADNVLITINADAMAQPIVLPIPINDPAPKRAAYALTYKDPAGSAAAQFRYNVNTRTFGLTARGLDLTGLACPFTITIAIGDYYTAAFTLEETLVNGAKKSLSPLFVRGLANTLTVEQYKFTPGKAYELDTLTAQGTFTYLGTPDKSVNPFILTLGHQSFTVDGGLFTLKNGVYTCKDVVLFNAARLTARLDTVKCTYAISLRNVFLETDGVTPFGMDVFGSDLTGLAAVDLGRIYTYWDLTGYDQHAASWQYKSKAGTTVSVVDSGNGVFDVIETEPSARTVLTFHKAPDNTMSFRGLQIDGSGSDVKLIIDNINLTMNPPAVRAGFIWRASSLFNGQLIVPGRTYKLLNQSMMASISLSPKAAVIKVPAGTFSTIPFTETWTSNAIVRSNGFDAGVATFVFTQTSYSAPGVGVVKRTRSVTLKLTLYGDGAYSRSASDNYQLLP